ncbi:MAG: hypothetical protein ACO1QB_11030 [Verrucomicrobiales bacterium]
MCDNLNNMGTGSIWKPFKPASFPIPWRRMTNLLPKDYRKVLAFPGYPTCKNTDARRDNARFYGQKHSYPHKNTINLKKFYRFMPGAQLKQEPQ